MATISPSGIVGEGGTSRESSSFMSGTTSDIEESSTAVVIETAKKGFDGRRRRSTLFVPENYEFAFENLSFSVPIRGKKEPKDIIRGLSGKMSSGDMMAVMGPSGAGKSTLLNILTHKAFGGKANGSIKLNGKDFSYSMFKEHCGFVDQHETLWNHLTPLEHLKYAADLVLSKDTKDEKEDRIDELLDMMGLKAASSTKVSRLSGGEKRRLSLAIAMLKKPKMLVLDEPTSGLDSASAAGIVKAMKRLTSETRVLIICTIHQPSFELFSEFSHVTLLSRGRNVYSGRRDEIIPYIESKGNTFPANINPADHLLTITNSDFSDAEKVNELIAAWEQKDETFERKGYSELTSHNKGKPNFLRQVVILLKRHSWLSMLDPALYWLRVVCFFLAGAFIAAVYIEIRDRTLDLAVQRVTVFGWVFSVPAFLIIGNVYQTSVEMNIITHEVRLGYVNPIAYVTAKTIIEIPFMFILALSSIGVGGFAMLNFNADNFGAMLLTFASTLFAFEALSYALAVAIPNLAIALISFLLACYSAFLFSEIWIAMEYVILPFRLLFYLSPFRLALQAFAYLDFSGTYFTCGENLSAFTSQQICIGTVSGEKVLEVLGTIVFPVLKPYADVPWCIGVTLIYALVFKTIYALTVMLRSNQHSNISSSDSKCNLSGVALKIFAVIAIVAAVSGVSIWMAREEDSASAVIGYNECNAALLSSGFDLRKFNDYDKFFDDNSVVTLAEAGQYQGPKNILEYVLFVFSSPYIRANVIRTDVAFKRYDSETNSCLFRTLSLQEFVPDGTHSNGDVNTFQVAVATNVELDFSSQIVSKVNIFYSEELLSFFFGNLLNTDATRRYVCSVINGPCGMQEDNCESKLAALPITTGATSITGKSQGCRALHAAFASRNPKHCPHISFEPKADFNGKINCQKTLDITPTDLFDEEDFNAFAEFNRQLEMDEKSGFIETTVKGTPNVCEQQEYYIRDRNISSYDQHELDRLDGLDFVEYSADPESFLQFRSQLCGRNFASLGKVIVGRHRDVVELLALDNQVRGKFNGRARLREDRLIFPFITTISDSDYYDALRSSLISNIILPAQENAEGNADLDSLVEKFVEDLTIFGGSSSSYRRKVIGSFVSRWIVRALFDMDIRGNIMEDLLEVLFRGDYERNFMASIGEPFASHIVSDALAKDLQDDFHRLGSLIKTFAVMDDYDTWGASLNMTKDVYSNQLGALLGVAGLNGLDLMLENLIDNIPTDVLDSIDYDDPDEIEDVVLESLRLHTAVRNVNILLKEEAVLNVGGEDKTFPKGTTVSSSLPLANWDDEVFSDPFVFNHMRENLKEDIVSFGIRGYHSDSFPRRSCPGQHLAMKVGKDVLKAWIRSRRSHEGVEL